jgi:hypothetical protein
MVAVLIGYALLGLMAATGQLGQRHLDLRSGLWVVPWLGGLTIVSYYGDYGGGEGVVGFGSGLWILAALSAVVYVLAFVFRLSPEQAQAYIEESLEEAAVEDEKLA